MMKLNELTTDELRLAKLGCPALTTYTLEEFSATNSFAFVEDWLPDFVRFGRLVDEGLLKIHSRGAQSRVGMPFDD